MKPALGSPTAAEWDVGLHRSFECAGRIVWVHLASLRGTQGELLFDVHWLPGPPVRLAPEDIASFDQGKRNAIEAIRTHLETLL